MACWALDLGTTNSALARWDEATGQPQLVELPGVCRHPDRGEPLEAPRMVPTAVHLLDEAGWLARLGGWVSPGRGRRALIGRPALERNRDAAHPAFVPAFKPALVGEPTRPLARRGRRPVSAREVAAVFLAELLAEVRRETGERVRDLVVTAPVSAFETYRAEVQQILGRLGVRRVRFLDEPVAAALGYGVGLGRDRRALVVDVGGGTMHAVLVALSARGALAGEARVLAKKGRWMGGNAVDGWVVEEACRLAGLPAPEEDGDEQARFWRRLMLAEACRVKEAVHFDETAVFRVVPPGLGARSASSLLTFTRAQLASLLESNGFYRGLEGCLDTVLADARLAAADVDDVLLVGGSTLLPGVFTRLEARFGRPRIRGWHPFEAVALGAACFAADRAFAADFIVHDYAFVTHEPGTGRPQHTIVVPRGTRFPTAPDLWKRQLVPTCSLGEPESIFRLVICEVERADGEGRRYVWDAAGDLQRVGGEGGRDEVVVPLNASSPTLGYLDPPHDPRDRRPRLEVAFGVSEERWLVATVHDLLTRKDLMREEPVVRLV